MSLHSSSTSSSLAIPLSISKVVTGSAAFGSWLSGKLRKGDKNEEGDSDDGIFGGGQSYRESSPPRRSPTLEESDSSMGEDVRDSQLDISNYSKIGDLNHLLSLLSRAPWGDFENKLKSMQSKNKRLKRRNKDLEGINKELREKFSAINSALLAYQEEQSMYINEVERLSRKSRQYEDLKAEHTKLLQHVQTLEECLNHLTDAAARMAPEGRKSLDVGQGNARSIGESAKSEIGGSVRVRAKLEIPVTMSTSGIVFSPPPPPPSPYPDLMMKKSKLHHKTQVLFDEDTSQAVEVGDTSPPPSFLWSELSQQRIQLKLRLESGVRGYAMRAEGVNILSLDGGGMRGLCTVEVLREMERLSGVAISDMFDLIVGTSTGGFAALCIGVKRMDMDQLSATYQLVRQNAEEGLGVGSATTVDDFKRLAGIGLSKREKNRQNVMRRVFGDDLMSEVGTSPKVAVTAAHIGTVPPDLYLLRTYEMPPQASTNFLGTSRCRVREAALATTAAPTYSLPTVISGQSFGDGALIVNNPVLVAVSEAIMLWPDRPINCVVSIGTGRTVNQWNPNPSSVVSWTKSLFEQALGCEYTHQLAGNLLQLNQLNYYRFDPDGVIPSTGKPISALDLAETRIPVLEEMVQVTRTYIARRKDEIKQCLKILARKEGPSDGITASGQGLSISQSGNNTSPIPTTVPPSSPSSYQFQPFRP